jgi:hypothetical protein
VEDQLSRKTLEIVLRRAEFAVMVLELLRFLLVMLVIPR